MGLPRLTRELIEEYGNRKREGMVSIIIDLDKNILLPIPRDTEHVWFVARYLNITDAEFKADPKRAARIIPSNIRIEEDTVTGIVTGVCGMELGYGVRHTAEDLQKAHALALAFASEGELLVELSINKIITL